MAEQKETACVYLLIATVSGFQEGTEVRSSCLCGEHSIVRDTSFVSFISQSKTETSWTEKHKMHKIRENCFS